MTIEQLTTPRSPAGRASEATAIEQARAVAEVAAAVRVAQDFPRDVDAARTEMQQACSTRALADRAFFSLPRAGGTIEGSSVHLARELARCWGNIDYGIRELRRNDAAGESEMQAWAWDQQRNSRSSRSFIVPHAIMSGRGAAKQRKALTDLTDVANNNNSVAARAVRETIFTILPVWFRVEAEETAMRTLQGGPDPDARQLQRDITEGIAFYARLGVTQQQLEARLGRPATEWTPQDTGFLRVLSGELSRGEKKVTDEFPGEQPAVRSAAADVAAQTATEHDPTADPSWKGGQQ